MRTMLQSGGTGAGVASYDRETKMNLKNKNKTEDRIVNVLPTNNRENVRGDGCAKHSD